MAETSKEVEAVREFLEREGIDVDRFIKEKETLMERKQVLGRRMELGVRMTEPPPYVEIEEEEVRR